MESTELRELARGLGQAFERRQMLVQLRCLREFSQALEPTGNQQRRPGLWSAQVVLNWAALLKVPPMENVYRVHRQGHACPNCGNPHAILRAEISWTGGTLRRCESCGYKWLEAL